MVVQHNLTAINANRYFGMNNTKLSKSLEKLSSGYAINRAGDNAAGLAVSEKMRSQIAGINQGVKNAQDGISMVQTFEGALTETDSILQRMKTLATQSANGTYDNAVDRNAIQKEFDQLNDELDQIADTDFNGVVVLNGGTMSDGMKADAKGNIDYSKWTARNNITSLNKFEDAANAKANTVNSYKGPVEDTTVTYAYNGKGKWVNTYNGNEITANKNGGFEGVFGDTIALDSSKLKAGDTITVNYEASEAPVKAAPATGDATVAVTGPADLTSVSIGEADKFTLANLDDSAMTPEIKAALEKLDGATIKFTAAKGTTTDKPADAAAITVTGIDAVVDGKTGTATAGNVTAAYDKATGKIEFYYNSKAEQIGNGTKLGEFQFSPVTNTDAATDADITYTLSVKLAQNTAGKVGKVEIVDDEASDADKAALLEKLDKSGVSVANAYEKSTSKLTYAKHIALQVGARSKDAVDFTFSYSCDDMGGLKADLNCTAEGLGTKNLSLASQEKANEAIDKIGNAINKVSMVRGTFGALQNRLEHKIDNLNVTSENLTSAESRIRDTNMAEEMMNFTKNQILSQASQSMLAQANQLPQGVLSLLQ